MNLINTTCWKILLFSVFVFSAGSASAENLTAIKVYPDSAITICKHADSTRFNDLKAERRELLKEVSGIRMIKDSIEKEGYKNGLTTKEYNRKIKYIENDLKKAERDLDRVQGKMNNIMRKIENKYSRNGKDFIRFYGDCTIEPGDKINSNVSVINGNITVKGNLNGNLILVNGEASRIQGGRVFGDVILVNSTFQRDSLQMHGEGIICGDVTGYDEYEYTWDNYNFRNWKWPNFRFPEVDWVDDGEVRYNRVEGLRIGIGGSKKFYWNASKKYSIYGTFGYGFANHRWTGSIAFDRWMGNENRTEIGTEAHSLIDSKDKWLIGQIENSLASFFLHEDFKDYYLRDGWSAHLAQYISKETNIRVEYSEETYQNQERNTDWALFGGDKKFRPNPEIDVGRYKSIIISVNHKTADIKNYEPRGWDVSASYEIAKGEYDYKRLWVDIRRYQPLFMNHAINARVIIGSIGSPDNYAPVQKRFDLGGLGTIPALPFKYDFSGNRLALFNVEYMLGFDDIFTLLFDDDFNINQKQDLVVFYDGGWLNRICPCDDLFKGFEIDNNYRHDIGVAFGFDRNTVRIGAAFRLDKNEPATLFLRISKPI